MVTTSFITSFTCCFVVFVGSLMAGVLATIMKMIIAFFGLLTVFGLVSITPFFELLSEGFLLIITLCHHHPFAPSHYWFCSFSFCFSSSLFALVRSKLLRHLSLPLRFYPLAT